MSTSIETKLRTAAIANAGLTALLGTAPFRWYNTQENQGPPPSAGVQFPCITAQQVSGVPIYNLGGRGPMNQIRVQFTIWEGPTPDTTDAVLQALRVFLDTFSAVQAGNFANQIVNDGRRGFYAATKPGIFQKFVDVMIWNNTDS